MPKIKTHSGAKKRFSVTKTGKIKRARMNRRHHIINIRAPKRRRSLRKGAFVDSTNVAQIKRLIPYK